MPSFTISILLYFFGVYLLGYLFYSLSNIYHLAKYGIYSSSLYVLIATFAGGTILLVGSCILFLLGYDWTVPLFINTLDQINTNLFFNT